MKKPFQVANDSDIGLSAAVFSQKHIHFVALGLRQRN